MLSCLPFLLPLSSASLFLSTFALGAGPVHHCQASAKQPTKQQGKRLQPGIPDISELSLELQQEWHPDNNDVFGGVSVKPHSNFRAKWECKNCPQGHPHIFFSAVYARTSNSKCPYCRGRRVCAHSCLATISPSVARFWNHDKNDNTPENTLAGSNVRAAWRCPDCSYLWQAPVHARVNNNSGCPKCSLAHQERVSQPTFESAKHHLLDEWYHKRNAKEVIFPHNTTLGSGRHVHWIYRWRTAAWRRTGRISTGCPCCAGKQVCLCNSLQSLCPDIASELDLDRNNITPADVTWSSNKIVWWKHDKRGSWEQSINGRTDKRRRQQT